MTIMPRSNYFGAFPFLPQRFTHRRAGVRFGDGIKVAIDISGVTVDGVQNKKHPLFEGAF